MSAETREVREIVLEKSKATVVLYEYITGRDKRYIQRAYYEQASMSSKTDQKENKSTIEIGGVSGTVNEEMENRAISCIVKEIKPAEGEVVSDKKAILDFILDLSSDEYDKVITEINAITDPKKA
jgi:hypothetical protein